MLTKGQKKVKSCLAYHYKYAEETSFCHPLLAFEYSVAFILLLPLISNFFILTLNGQAWT